MNTSITEVVDALEKAKDHAAETYKVNGSQAYDMGVYEGIKQAVEIVKKQASSPAR